MGFGPSDPAINITIFPCIECTGNGKISRNKIKIILYTAISDQDDTLLNLPTPHAQSVGQAAGVMW